MTDAEIRAAIQDAHDRILETFKEWRAASDVDPKAAAAGKANDAYFEAVAAMNALHIEIRKSKSL